MFEKLKTLKGSKKHLILVTDASDILGDVDGLKRAWEECQKYHKQKGGFIAGNALFIGSGSSRCTKEIQAIFGRVDVVDPDKVEKVLKKLQVVIAAADKCDKELGVIKNRVKQLNLKNPQNESLLQQSEEIVSNLTKNIEQGESKTQEIQNEVEFLKTELITVKDMAQQSKDKAEKVNKRLEEMQTTLLSRSSLMLSNIDLIKTEVEKQRHEADQEQKKIDETIDEVKKGIDEMEEIQVDLNCLQSSLKDPNNNSVEAVLEELINASKVICTKAKSRSKTLMQVCEQQKKLNGLQKSMSINQKTLETLKNEVNSIIDALFGMLN